MTVKEQTTAERILALIGMNYRIIQHGETRIADHSKAADMIAAEIDGLTAQLAEARAEVVDLKLELVDRNTQLAEARAQIAALTPAAEAYRACVRWENASSYGTQEECAAAWTEYLAATRRAFVPGATP